MIDRWEPGRESNGKEGGRVMEEGGGEKVIEGRESNGGGGVMEGEGDRGEGE